MEKQIYVWFIYSTSFAAKKFEDSNKDVSWGVMIGPKGSEWLRQKENENCDGTHTEFLNINTSEGTQGGV